MVNPRLPSRRTGEQFFDIAGVASSILATPTIFLSDFNGLAWLTIPDERDMIGREKALDVAGAADERIVDLLQ